MLDRRDRHCGRHALHRGFIPSVDATVVRKLREAGAILLGKLQLTEGAFADHHPDVAAPLNPWHRDHWSGASSSGSGVATAAGLCFGSLGLGYRRLDPLSLRGQRQHRPEADLGPGLALRLLRARRLARPHRPDVPERRRCGVMLGAIAGSDPAIRPRCAATFPTTSPADDGTLRGVRIGFDERYALDDVDADTRRAVETALREVRSLGAEIVTVRFPDVADAARRLGPNCAVETAVAHAETFPAQRRPLRAGAGRAHRRGSRAVGRSTTSESSCAGATSPAASSPRSMPSTLMLVPAQPIAAPTVARMATLGQVPGQLAALTRFTAPFDMSGHPTLTLPVAFTTAGLPIGAQFVGRHLGEPAIVRVGRAFQRATEWHRRHPKV